MDKSHAVCCQVGYVVVRVRLNGKVHKLWGSVGWKRKSMPHLCANFPIGLLVQVCCEQHACTCIANILKWANNEGQHACRAIGVVLRHQTTVVFRAKGKGTPPPPGGLPKGASSGKRPTSILLRKDFNIYGTYLFAIQPSLATRWPLHCSHHLWP